MAHITASVYTSHVPAIGAAITPRPRATIAVAATTCTTPAATGVPGVNSTAFGPGNNPANLAFGQESVNKWEIGVNYALGPGVKLTGGGLLYTASGPSAAVSGNSWGLLMGMDLRF